MLEMVSTALTHYSHRKRVSSFGFFLPLCQPKETAAKRVTLKLDGAVPDTRQASSAAGRDCNQNNIPPKRRAGDASATPLHSGDAIQRLPRLLFISPTTTSSLAGRQEWRQQQKLAGIPERPEHAVSLDFAPVVTRLCL